MAPTPITRIRRTWHHTLQRLNLWRPANPQARLWDKDMNYIGTLGHPQPAHYTWPWTRRTAPRTAPHQPGVYLQTWYQGSKAIGQAYINVTVDFDEAGHEQLAAARQQIATLTTALGEWRFTQDEQDIMGLQPGDRLGPGIVGQPTPRCATGPCDAIDCQQCVKPTPERNDNV